MKHLGLLTLATLLILPASNLEKMKEGSSAYLVSDLFQVKPYVAEIYQQYRAKK